MYKIENKSELDTELLFISKNKYDVKLECKEGIVKAHKIILEMKCKYFEILFSEKYSDNKKETIMFEDVSYTSLNETMRYIYTGKYDIRNI